MHPARRLMIHADTLCAAGHRLPWEGDVPEGGDGGVNKVRDDWIAGGIR